MYGRTAPSNASGWTLGAGLEYKINRNWSAKAEYQYFNFGNLNYTVFNAGLVPFPFRQTLNVSTVKVGLNYAF